MMPDAVHEVGPDVAFHYPKSSTATLTATPEGTTVDFSADFGEGRKSSRILVQNLGGADIGVHLDGTLPAGRAVIRAGQDREFFVQKSSIIVTGAAVSFIVTAFRRL